MGTNPRLETFVVRRELKEGITPLLRLSTSRPLLPVLTTLSVCTALTVEIIGENLTGGLGPKPNESPSKEDKRSSIKWFHRKIDR
ncbi:hypothetical protein AYI68_g3290 [Smittium mucronatum]|uniref:Uncharacterized protein n=1 Tax=Smittium mucronatum TaxID=133383 RepID=A0A1R0H0D9_9FUNG|nr:hypothetical protein AYI68_g3290 [Smittium mucronatum]